MPRLMPLPNPPSPPPGHLQGSASNTEREQYVRFSWELELAQPESERVAASVLQQSFGLFV